MIQIDDLRFCYRAGDFRLSVPELAVADGESLAIVGPSGSGKTTLLNLIAGILEATAGRIEVAGNAVSQLGEAARRDYRIEHMGLVFQEFELLEYLSVLDNILDYRIEHMGLVFQEFELLEYLSVLDNILLPYRITQALELNPAARERARRLAADVGIADKLRRYPGQLSQGERQRVAICRAIIVEPPLLLADEPTGNLDPGNKGRVLDILFDYARDTGATLVTVTHDHGLIGRFDRLIDFQDFLAPGTDAT